LPKPTRASVTKAYTRDIVGDGEVEYLMRYRSDGSATFVGLERVIGRIAGKSGSFVLQRSGVFEDGQAKESHSVIPGSATGELQGLVGDGMSALGHTVAEVAPPHGAGEPRRCPGELSSETFARRGSHRQLDDAASDSRRAVGVRLTHAK